MRKIINGLITTAAIAAVVGIVSLLRRDGEETIIASCVSAAASVLAILVGMAKVIYSHLQLRLRLGGVTVHPAGRVLAGLVVGLVASASVAFAMEVNEVGVAALSFAAIAVIAVIMVVAFEEVLIPGETWHVILFWNGNFPELFSGSYLRAKERARKVDDQEPAEVRSFARLGDARAFHRLAGESHARFMCEGGGL